MSTYWPWWAGALGLALITIVHTIATDRSLGVSSAWDRVLHWRRERRIERMEDEFTDERALADALAAATAEHFGPAPTAAPGSPQAPYGQAPYGQAPYEQAPYEHAPYAPYEEERPPVTYDEPPSESSSAAGLRPAPLITQAALLVSIFLGGWIAAATSGRFELRFDMGAGFRNLVTADPALMVGLLFAGGLMVGFGTRLAGGCSSGHGLSGCGRLRPISLVATAVFFGTATAVSFLLWKVI